MEKNAEDKVVKVEIIGLVAAIEELASAVRLVSVSLDDIRSKMVVKGEW